MKKKGILFSLSAFLLVLSIISLVGALNEITHNKGKPVIELGALISVNNKFDEVMEEMVSLNKYGYDKQAMQRLLPFDYNFLDKNSLEAMQEIPVRSYKMDGFFDAINALKVFFEDSNQEHGFEGGIVNIETVENSYWGGTATGARFFIEPQCLSYQVIDENNAGFVALGGLECGSGFDLSASLREFDANIFLETESDDFNRVSCNINGSLECLNEAFDSGNPNPFIRVIIHDENCDNCLIDANTLVQGHFNPLVNNTVTISCLSGGASCVSTEAITISFDQNLLVNYEGSTPIRAGLIAVMKQGIDDFYFPDTNITVSKPDFGLTKKNQGLS